jgi:putative tryptophan/tyrosine transport system substrate-binding protein
MTRREFITLLGGAAAWPMAARAQHPERVRRIGVLMDGADTDATAQSFISALRVGLQRQGWIEGRNMHVEDRWAGGDSGRVRDHAAELVAMPASHRQYPSRAGTTAADAYNPHCVRGAR